MLLLLLNPPPIKAFYQSKILQLARLMNQTSCSLLLCFMNLDILSLFQLISGLIFISKCYWVIKDFIIFLVAQNNNKLQHFNTSNYFFQTSFKSKNIIYHIIELHLARSFETSCLRNFICGTKPLQLQLVGPRRYLLGWKTNRAATKISGRPRKKMFMFVWRVLMHGTSQCFFAPTTQFILFTFSQFILFTLLC